ncbi:Tensin-3, partial [Stegodyphus mimosarum]
MNSNRIVTTETDASKKKKHSCMASTMSDYPGPRPDSLHPTNPVFPDKERGNLWSPCSNCSSSDENNSPTALNSFIWDKPALEDKTVDFGWSSTQTSGKNSRTKASERLPKEKHKPSGYVDVQSGDKDFPDRISSKRESRPNKSCENKTVSSSQEKSFALEERLQGLSDTLESDDAQDPTEESCLNQRSEEEIMKEKEDLRDAAWFQAGIPREIALEVLAEKPEGSFIVRESTTKPGCYALSLRVPPGRNPTGIAHYLILHTNKGYKIKGFTKEFSSLSALITHHSVMPELLPCPLSLCRHSTRDAEKEFEETEQKKCDIFSDIHWLMTDLEL